MKIVKLADQAKKEFKNLGKYQKGKFKPVVTGREWLDDVFGGLLPNDIVTIAGASGGGKSFELQRVKNNVMDINLNPEANEFVWLDNSLEMKLISNIIRDLNSTLKKSKRRILLEEFSDDEKKLVEDYYNNLTDGRFYINEEADDADTFEKGCREFLDFHADKKGVFISIDHIALQRGTNDGKKSAIDDIIEAINRIKKDYSNAYFIILSQLNRGVLGRIKEKDVIAMPNRSDLYQSDTIFHISDYVYVTHNPHRLGINLFSKVNKEVYSYLEDHFGEVKGNKAFFKTFGKIFFIVLKSREASVMFKDIFIEDIEFEGKENFRALENDSDTSGDTDDVPIFGKKEPEVLNPNSIMSTPNLQGFGFDTEKDEDDDDFDPPF